MAALERVVSCGQDSEHVQCDWALAGLAIGFNMVVGFLSLEGDENPTGADIKARSLATAQESFPELKSTEAVILTRRQPDSEVSLYAVLLQQRLICHESDVSAFQGIGVPLLQRVRLPEGFGLPQAVLACFSDSDMEWDIPWDKAVSFARDLTSVGRVDCPVTLEDAHKQYLQNCRYQVSGWRRRCAWVRALDTPLTRTWLCRRTSCRPPRSTWRGCS